MRHGSNLDPPNRFETIHREPDLDYLDWDQEHLALKNRKIEYIDDSSNSIVSENNSPDIPFRYSLNPYRGCIHACAYCYARPTHEYLGFNAGLDFETKITVKRNATELFRQFLSRRHWQLEPIAFSGVTDCYQPAERQFRLTRGCLEIALSFRQPVSIVTKNALIVRDLDLLAEMAQQNLIHAYLSITTLDSVLAREMEPRTSIPAARLRAIETLADAGVPVGVMVAPVIPGLNDSEIPAILKAASAAGAGTSGYVLLRLPLTVQPVFTEWIQRVRPDHAERVLGRVRETRGGAINDSAFGQRMTGTGQIADQIRKLYKLFQKQSGLDQPLTPFNCNDFQVPQPDTGQLRLF